MNYQVISIISAPIIMMVSTFAQLPTAPSKSPEWAADRNSKMFLISDNTKKCDEPNGEKGCTARAN